eukprot:6721291-Pyramimonas_sp.AAC.1
MRQLDLITLMGRPRDSVVRISIPRVVLTVVSIALPSVTVAIAFPSSTNDVVVMCCTSELLQHAGGLPDTSALNVKSAIGTTGRAPSLGAANSDLRS